MRARSISGPRRGFQERARRSARPAGNRMVRFGGKYRASKVPWRQNPAFARFCPGAISGSPKQRAPVRASLLFRKRVLGGRGACVRPSTLEMYSENGALERPQSAHTCERTIDYGPAFANRYACPAGAKRLSVREKVSAFREHQKLGGFCHQATI